MHKQINRFTSDTRMWKKVISETLTFVWQAALSTSDSAVLLELEFTQNGVKDKNHLETL